ncbi:MAG TPA: hypothetical protein PK514_15010 [Spirochaetota bacterium]|nr:hypothetical protein [Spirochaetota bacterium]
MNRILVLIILMIVSDGEIYELPVKPEVPAIKKAVPSREFQIQKQTGKPVAPDPYMDGVVIGKSIDFTNDPSPRIKYTICIRTNKGLVKEFGTTENNYSILEKGYSVHYVLTGSRRYKLVKYVAPE